MKKNISYLLVSLFALFLAAGNLFAQSKRISANGVTVPEWMQNCEILQSEYAFGSTRTIGQVLSIPKESPTLTTKIKSVTVKDKNLYLVYQVMDKDKTVVATLKVDFVCSKYKNAGYCFISAISIENHLKFNKLSYTCSNPNTYPREHGQCLGTLLEIVNGFFTDEVALNKQREAEAKTKKSETDELAGRSFQGTYDGTLITFDFKENGVLHVENEGNTILFDYSSFEYNIEGNGSVVINCVHRPAEEYKCRYDDWNLWIDYGGEEIVLDDLWKKIEASHAARGEDY